MGMRMQDKTDPKNNTEEEVVVEEVVNPEEGKTMEEVNAEIEAELEAEAAKLDPQAQMEADVLKWKDAAMRAAADLENFRKRMAREKMEAIKFGNQRLIEELLPIVDNFNMGMMAAEQDSDSMIYKGMQMVLGQIEGFLSSQGVTEETPAAGTEFNPNIHDAMSQEVSETHEDGKIIRVMRKGYKMGDRLVRPANVVVAHTPEPVAEAEAE